MQIKFTSVSTPKHSEEPQTISFTAELTRTTFENFDCLTFIEPSSNINNRIEINENQLNIFAGPSTIEMEKNKKILNTYVVPTQNNEPMNLFMSWFLKDIEHKFEDKKEIYKIKYSLFMNQDEIEPVSDFDITLEIF